MLISNRPLRAGIIWAQSATSTYVRTPPQTSQTGGAASYPDGFPALTFESQAAGGVPPDGRDMNGILRDLTNQIQFVNAGGPAAFDATFATEVGGYPAGARLASTNGHTIWVSTADNNTTDPDGASPSNWIELGAPTFTAGTNSHAIRYPGGWTRQTGIAFGVNPDSTVTVNFPVAFKTAPNLWDCGTAWRLSSPNMGTDDNATILTGTPTTTQMQVSNNKINGGAAGDVIWWAEGFTA